jgi:hypothetical protein
MFQLIRVCIRRAVCCSLSADSILVSVCKLAVVDGSLLQFE